MVAVFVKGGELLLSGLPPELRHLKERIGAGPETGKTKGELMKQKIIEASITKDGKTKLHVKGADGGACESLTAAMEARLGAVESKEYTPERYNMLAAEQHAGQQVVSVKAVQRT